MIRTIGGRRSGAEGGAYRFSAGRTLSAKPLARGLYANVIGFYLLLEQNAAAADVRGECLLAEDGSRLLLE